MFWGVFSLFLGVKFWIRKCCLCKRNDKYQICPFVGSSVRWFARSLVRPFVDSSVHWFVRSLVRPKGSYTSSQLIFPSRRRCGETFVSLRGHKLESSPQRLDLPKTRKIPGFGRAKRVCIAASQQMIPPPPLQTDEHTKDFNVVKKPETYTDLEFLRYRLIRLTVFVWTVLLKVEER